MKKKNYFIVNHLVLTIIILLGHCRTTEAFSLRPAYVPYHSFSQLASSKSGMEILIKHSEIHDMLSRLHNANDKHWIKIKAAIWGNNYN